MSKLFFIDSENVGDSWVSLLATATPEDEILVFYTAKSPHMNYKNLVLLKQSPKEVIFIECSEGNNGLDFQLSTELGFRLHDFPDAEFVIVSNDTGFDAVVKYWKAREISIKRIKGSACSVKTPAPEPDDTPKASQDKAKETAPAKSGASTASGKINEEDAREIFYIFGKENLAGLHEALKKLYGDKRGKELYTAFKSGNSYNDFLAGHKKMNQAAKQQKYFEILFTINGEKLPEDFSSFVISSWKKKKNLNSLKSLMQGHFAKDKYSVYYDLIKPHIKIVDSIK